jgi:hypothetical protein
LSGPPIFVTAASCHRLDRLDRLDFILPSRRASTPPAPISFK